MATRAVSGLWRLGTTARLSGFRWRMIGDGAQMTDDGQEPERDFGGGWVQPHGFRWRMTAEQRQERERQSAGSLGAALQTVEP